MIDAKLGLSWLLQAAGTGRQPTPRHASSGEECADARADWRELVLVSLIASGVAITITTEALSAGSLLAPGFVWGSWVLWTALVASVVMLRRHALTQPKLPPGRGSRLLLFGIVTITLLIGVVAFYAPPNTSDSLSYHMSRVANWDQQHGVRNYPAGYLPQLYQPPWAEFAILQLQVISGSDRFANFVQWLSMLASLVITSLIARYLGANSSGQLLAAVFAATLPVGILEASGTQNDYVATLWLGCFVAATCRIWIAAPARPWPFYVAAGAALGLALNTKGTNYLYAPAWLAVLGLLHLVLRRKRELALMTLLGTVALAINAGYFARNYDVFGSVLGPGRDEVYNSTYVVDSLSLNGFVSNIVRNVGLHLGTLDTDVNHTIYDDIVALHGWLGIPPDSPGTTFGGMPYTHSAVQLEMHDSRSGNFVGLILLVLTLAAGWASGSFVGKAPIYILAWLTSFAFFCLLLKWQLWNARLHLAWFVLGAPLVGLVWTQRLSPVVWRWLGAGLLILGMHAVLNLGEGSPRRLAGLLVGPALAGVMVWFGWNRLLQGGFVRRLGRRLTTAGGVAANYAWMGIGAALLVSALPWITSNEIRPLLGEQSVLVVPRITQYFLNLPELEAPYRWAASRVRQEGCSQVGLVLQAGAWDYPMWVVLRDQLPQVAIKNVDVPNVSARLVGPSFSACAIIALRHVDGEGLMVEGIQFRRVIEPLDSTGAVAVFLPMR
jgi:hypothetical protein